MNVKTHSGAGHVHSGSEFAPGAREEYAVVHRHHVGPWLLAAVAALATAGLVYALATNPYLDWGVTAHYLFAGQILRGVVTTVELSIYSMILGVLVGVVIGVGRMSHNAVLSGLAFSYVAVFRSVPVLVQLLIWGNVGLIVRNVALGIPFTDVRFFSIQTNELIGPFTAAILGLALAEGAYIAEIVRAGIGSVDKGQREAASSLGMSSARSLRRIVLPQALRVIIPPLGNEFVTLIKGTSLVAVIAGGDLLTQAQNVAASNYRVIEMIAVAVFWYLVLVAVASVGQYFLERHYSRGVDR